MRRASTSLEQVTARGSTPTAAELVSPAMTAAAIAREGFVCIFAGTRVLYTGVLLKRLLVDSWLLRN